MAMTREIIIYEILIPSLQKLYKVDYDNIKFDVSERNICARLSLHIENKMRKYDRDNNRKDFHRYYADVEYNRMNNGDIKHYENSKKVRQKMVSDLLIQSRSISPNYLALELKKKKNKDERDENRERLLSLMKPSGADDCVHGTLVGAFVIYSPDDVMIELYENVDGKGEKTEDIEMIYDKERKELLISEDNR